MIQFTWKGPLLGHKNRLLTPNRTVEMDPNDPDTQKYLAMGYLEKTPPPPKAQKNTEKAPTQSAAPAPKADKKETT